MLPTYSRTPHEQSLLSFSYEAQLEFYTCTNSDIFQGMLQISVSDLCKWMLDIVALDKQMVIFEDKQYRQVKTKESRRILVLFSSFWIIVCELNILGTLDFLDVVNSQSNACSTEFFRDVRFCVSDQHVIVMNFCMVQEYIASKRILSWINPKTSVTSSQSNGAPVAQLLHSL